MRNTSTEARKRFDGKRRWKWGDIKLRKLGESKHQNEMGMNPDSCLSKWFETENAKSEGRGTTIDQTKHSWFSTEDPKRKIIKKPVRRDEDLPPREILSYPQSLRSLPPRKFRDKILKESSKRREEMSKGIHDYMTTSTDYVDMTVGEKIRTRGRLEVRLLHLSLSLSFFSLTPQPSQDELSSIQNQIEHAKKASQKKKNKSNRSSMDKKTERIVRRHYQSETHRSQARKIPRSAYEKNNTASHTPTIVNRYADSLAQYKRALPDRSRTGF